MTSVYRRRLIVNRVNLVMSLGTMAFGMMFLLWILWVLSLVLLLVLLIVFGESSS